MEAVEYSQMLIFYQTTRRHMAAYNSCQSARNTIDNADRTAAECWEHRSVLSTFCFRLRTQQPGVSLFALVTDRTVVVSDTTAHVHVRLAKYPKGGHTLVTLPRIVTPYRDSVGGTRARVTCQKLVTR